MQNKNICKFIPQSQHNNLSVVGFIKESNPETMEKKIKLNHQHMILVTQGNGIFQFDEKEVPFKTGSLVFGFDYEWFSAKCFKSCECIYIMFEGMRANELFHLFNINKDNRVFNNFEGLIPLWTESLSGASELTVELAAESMLLYTFSRLSSNIKKQNDIIRRILAISEEQLTNCDLSIANIAQELGYNSKYLSHHFKEKMGVAFSEYLRTLRIKYAVSLFEHGIDSVKNVALLSGFTDPLYFSTVFKKSTGVSPKEYKKKLS